MTTNLKIVNPNSQSITFDGQALHIRDYTLDSPEIIEYMNGKEDPTQAFIDLVDGALLMRRIANSSAEAEKLGAVAAKITSDFASVSKDATSEIAEIVTLHTDEANPDALANILKNKVLKSIVDGLKPTNQDSPFFEIAENLSKVLTEVTKQAGAKEVIDNSPVKGGNFNLTMDGIIQKIANGYGDSAIYVNDIKSESGSKVGDEIVTLNTEHTNGLQISNVWEFKTEKSVSITAALKELKEAIENRDSVAGVFVLARDSKNAHWSDYSIHPGNRMIILVDQNEPDIYLIKFAYMWARWVALRSLEKMSETFNLDRIESLLTDASIVMKDFAQVKKAHTGIKTSLDEAITWTNGVEGKLKGIFNEIDGALEGDK